MNPTTMVRKVSVTEAHDKKTRPYRAGNEVKSYISVPRKIDDLIKRYSLQHGIRKKESFRIIFSQFFDEHPLN